MCLAFGLVSGVASHPRQPAHPRPFMASHFWLVATEDDPERGIQAGDLFRWEHDGGRPRLRQVREWKNAADAMGLLADGVLSPLDDVAHDAALRQTVGAGRRVPARPPLKELK